MTYEHIRVHTSDIRMIYEWHTNDILMINKIILNFIDIRVTYKRIQMTYE